MIRKNFRDLLLSAVILILTASGCNVALCQTVVKQSPSVPVKFCISADEMELYHRINDYRKQYNLPPIPLSKSLSHVAALHARDLFLHHPDQGACNFHSWSNKGTWTPFCYPRDESKKYSVWDKPRELTKYPSKGYEIVYWENSPLVKDTIIMVWKMEDYFNSFLLNTGKWQGKTWNAIGIAVYENYACAWFGEVPDPEGEVFVCGSKPEVKVKDTVKPAVKSIVKPPVKPKKGKTTKPIVKKRDSLEVDHADTLSTRPTDQLSVNPPITTLPKDSTSGTYFIIVKTNLSLEASNKFVSSLKAGDYPNAKVLEKDGKCRISAFESSDKANVMAKLKEVKKTYKDAWLLKK